MKKILFALAAVAMMLAGCTKGFDERLSKLEERVDALEEFVTNLNKSVEGIRVIVDRLEQNVYVTGVETTDEGYKLTFNQGNPIEIKHGKTGAQGLTGADGLTPTIDVYTDGKWYWKLTGKDGKGDKWMLDSEGKMVPALNKLEFSVDEGVLYVSIEGSPVVPIGSVRGDSWFEDVRVEGDKVVIDVKGTDNDLELPFNAAAAEEKFELNLNLPANTEVLLGGTIKIGYTLVGCAAADAVVFVQAPEDWNVELNESAQTVSLTVGEKAGRVVVYAINNVTGEVRAKFVSYDPEAMLIIGVEKSTFYLLPDGSGSIEIPVSTGLSYRVEKSDWLTVAEAPATKAMTHKVYTVTAGENTTGNTRDGEVNFWTSDGSKLLYTVTVSQNGYNPALLVDGEGNPIKWQETFKLLAGGSEKASYKNDFTFALSDDFSKGTYKITNMFYATSFHDANMQLMTNQGGEYYADLEDGILTVYRANSNKSYGFTSDVKVAWDSANNTFSIADPINVGYITGMGNNVMLSEYAAKIKVDEPAGAADWSSLYGVYNESTSAPHASSKETLVISESDNSDYDLKMLFFYTEGESSYSYDTAYGKVAADGKSITVTVPNNSNFAGPVSDFVLNVDGNTISGSYAGLCEYSASKPAGFDASVLYGEYWETFSGYPTPGTTVIEASDKSGYDLKITFFKPMYGSNCDVVYGKVNSNGTVITIDGFTSNFFGPCSSFTINVDGTNLSGNYAGSLAYTAVKK